MNIANSEGFKNSFVIDNNSNLNSNNEENIEQKTPSPDDWLAFFHSLDVLKDINHLSQWNQSYYRGMTGTAFIVGGGSGRLYVDNPTQYTTKVPIGSTFCNSLSNFTIDSDSYPVYYQGNKVPFSDICN